jgi:hypothetical protein
MNHYKVRVHMLSPFGFLTQADHYKDFEIDSGESLEVFAERLASKGFHDEESQRWIMPGAIAWISQK